MLLSIVLMIKNEEKYLENTLKALEVLRNNINSELIILDTGSIDKSIEIARKYTDNIYFSKWNDDFGQMRNKSISYAKGEWILVLDADEELVVCDKMIEFFNTDLYKKYNSASIELKNINSEDDKLYTKSINIRMFKKDGFRYEGVIHEQPMYKEPTYNNIAAFNHYGYLYTDEEQKKNKLERNEKLLRKVLKKNPNDSYINFQMAKNLMSMDENEDAIYYMEKSFEICKKNNNIPAYVQSNLAKLYILLERYSKCEKICIDYIQKDTKNIDIYYYLALSQSMNNKYNDSLINYKRYIYLLDNYEISTQHNNILCDGNTIGLREQVEVYIVKTHYLLEKYDEVYSKITKLNIEQIRSIYSIIFISIIKVNKIEYILDLYQKLNSNVEKNEFKSQLEKVLLKIGQSSKSKIYEILKKIEGNYGILNEIRCGKTIDIKEYNRILNEENDDYYSILIDYAIKAGFEIERILEGVDKIYIQDYFDYMIKYRKGNTIDLYEYLLTRPNTLEVNKLSIYSSLCKSLLSNVNYNNEKYLMLFHMYITYTYDYLKLIYNNELSDDYLSKVIDNKDEKFVIDIINARKFKISDKLNYIRKMKKILIDNQLYEKGIKILINKFEDEINENEEVKRLKREYKSIIERSINNGNIKDALSMVEEYESMFENDMEIYNMKGIINIFDNNLDEAECLFKQALLLDRYNSNTLFNIAYLKEISGENEEAIRFYNNICLILEERDLVSEAEEKIKLIKNICT